jgi:hypothetical protein
MFAANFQYHFTNNFSTTSILKLINKILKFYKSHCMVNLHKIDQRR